MKYDDERANRTFSVFLIGVGLSMAVGFLMGAAITFLYFN